jgi:hypothetical protein
MNPIENHMLIPDHQPPEEEPRDRYHEIVDDELTGATCARKSDNLCIKHKEEK